MYCELQYTSAPSGLLPGSSGYCTVKATVGIPSALRTALERLSHYRHLFPPGDASASLNPIAWSHTIVSAAGQQWHVLSRTCASGVDHTRRSNNFSHHIALTADGLPDAGPIWLLSQPGLVETTWDKTVEELPKQHGLPSGSEGGRVCKRWESVTGDAGWGGVVAAHLANSNAPAVLVFELGQDVLPLFRESVALMSGAQRWDVTFNTFFTGQSGETSYRLRGVVAGSPELAQLRRLPQVLIVDLTNRLGAAPDGEYVDAARNGAQRRSRGASASSREARPASIALANPDTSLGTTSSPGRKSLASPRPQPPPFAPGLPPKSREVAVPGFVLFGGGLLTGIALTVCMVMAIHFIQAPVPILPKVDRPVADRKPVVPEKKSNEPADDIVGVVDPAFSQLRKAIHPVALAAGATLRYEVNEYAELSDEPLKIIPVERKLLPLNVPCQVELLGLPKGYRLEHEVGQKDSAEHWTLRDGNNTKCLEISLTNSSKRAEHRDLVLKAVPGNKPAGAVAFSLENSVLVLMPKGGHSHPFLVALRMPPQRFDQPIELSLAKPSASIRLDEGLPKIPFPRNRDGLVLRDLRVEVRSPLNLLANQSAAGRLPELATGLEWSWSEPSQSIILKWTPNDAWIARSDWTDDTCLVIRGFRLSYLVNSVPVDIVRVDDTNDVSDDERETRQEPNPKPQD